MEVNREETKYIVMSYHQNIGQNHNILTAKKSFKSVVNFKYLGTIITIKILFMKKLRAD
jgi:hypothetical protein